MSVGRDQQYLVCKPFDGEHERYVAGTELPSPARPRRTPQRVTLHAGGQVTGVEVVKRKTTG